ncbi:hypothetical protein [Dyadobacter luteus]|nr:hypothetical protein [Dyadobacter luteus]
MLCLILLGACSKDTAPQPEQPAIEKTKAELSTEILGKWTLGLESVRTLAETGSIEFLADSTFIYQELNKNGVVGKYLVVSGNEITLANNGKVSGISIEGTKLSGSVTWNANTVKVSGDKVSIAITGSKTELLARAWTLTKFEDGYILNDNDLGADKINVIFSKAGTYFGQFLAGTHIVEEANMNWKWHSTKSDRLVYWETGSQVNEEKNYVIIRELTSSILKTTEYTDGEETNFTFIPLK